MKLGFTRINASIDVTFYDSAIGSVFIELDSDLIEDSDGAGLTFSLCRDEMEQLVEAWNTAEQKRLKELVGTSL